MSVKLTPREQQILAALTSEPSCSWEIARRAGIHTMSRGETAAKFCISLTKKGLAEKHGTRMFPKWTVRSVTVALPEAQKTL